MPAFRSAGGENFFLFFGQSVITAFYFHFTAGVLSAKSFATFVPLAALGAVLYRRAVPDIVLPPALCELLRLPGCTVSCEQLAGALPMYSCSASKPGLSLALRKTSLRVPRAAGSSCSSGVCHRSYRTLSRGTRGNSR